RCLLAQRRLLHVSRRQLGAVRGGPRRTGGGQDRAAPHSQGTREAHRLDHERIRAQLRACGRGDQRNPCRGDGAGRDRLTGRRTTHPHRLADLRAALLGGLLRLRVCTGEGHRPALAAPNAVRDACYPTAVPSISIMSSGNARRATPSNVPAGNTPTAPSRVPITWLFARNASTSVV